MGKQIGNGSLNLLEKFSCSCANPSWGSLECCGFHRNCHHNDGRLTTCNSCRTRAALMLIHALPLIYPANKLKTIGLNRRLSQCAETSGTEVGGLEQSPRATDQRPDMREQPGERQERHPPPPDPPPSAPLGIFNLQEQHITALIRPISPLWRGVSIKGSRPQEGLCLHP